MKLPIFKHQPSNNNRAKIATFQIVLIKEKPHQNGGVGRQTKNFGY